MRFDVLLRWTTRDGEAVPTASFLGVEDINVADLHPKKFIARTLNEAALPTAEIREIVQQAKIDPDLL